jgi:hypothetical protein
MAWVIQRVIIAPKTCGIEGVMPKPMEDEVGESRAVEETVSP